MRLSRIVWFAIKSHIQMRLLISSPFLVLLEVSMRRYGFAALAMLLALAVGSNGWLFLSSRADDKKVDPAAVDRARKNVKMLDDVYKTTVVLVTDKYVNSKKDF